MNNMTEVEKLVQEWEAEKARGYAEKLTTYCNGFKRCTDGCTFWIGCCKLATHPSDWEDRNAII